MKPYAPVYAIRLPGYRIDSRPDYSAVGARLDSFIEQHLPHRRMALRGIYLQDHPDLSRTELVTTILELGTDRYDPERKSIHHDYFGPLGVDLHAVPCEVTDRLRGLKDDDYVKAPSFSGEFIRDFFESARAERGYSLRLDILIAYDLNLLVAVPAGATMSYAFKYPDRKRDALLAVINVF